MRLGKGNDTKIQRMTVRRAIEETREEDGINAGVDQAGVGECQ